MKLFQGLKNRIIYQNELILKLKKITLKREPTTSDMASSPTYEGQQKKQSYTTKKWMGGDTKGVHLLENPSAPHLYEKQYHFS